MKTGHILAVAASVLCSLASPPGVLGQLSNKHVVELLIKLDPTSTDADLDRGSALTVELINDAGVACVLRFDAEENYPPGDIIGIDGPDLEACLYFPGSISRMAALHEINDGGVIVAHYRVLFSDSTFVQCNSGTYLNDGEIEELACTAWPGEAP